MGPKLRRASKAPPALDTVQEVLPVPKKDVTAAVLGEANLRKEVAQVRPVVEKEEKEARERVEADWRRLQEDEHQRQLKQIQARVDAIRQRESERAARLGDAAALSVRQARLQACRAALRRRVRHLRPLPYRRRAAFGLPVTMLPADEAPLGPSVTAFWDTRTGGVMEDLAQLLTQPGEPLEETMSLLRLCSVWWLRARRCGEGSAARSAGFLRDETFDTAMIRWPLFASRVARGEEAPEAGMDRSGEAVRITPEWVRERWSPAAPEHWRLRSWMLRVVAEGFSGPPTPAEVPPVAGVEGAESAVRDVSMRINRSAEAAARDCDAVGARLTGLSHRLCELRGGADLTPEPPDCPRLRSLVTRLLSLPSADVLALPSQMRPSDDEQLAPLQDPLTEAELHALEDSEHIDPPTAFTEPDGVAKPVSAMLAAGAATVVSLAIRGQKLSKVSAVHRWLKVSLFSGALAQPWDTAAMAASYSSIPAPAARDRSRSVTSAIAAGRCFAAVTRPRPGSAGGEPHGLPPLDWGRLRDGDRVVSYAPTSATLCVDVAIAALQDASTGECDPSGAFVTFSSSPAALRAWEDVAAADTGEAEVILPPLQVYRVSKRPRAHDPRDHNCSVQVAPSPVSVLCVDLVWCRSLLPEELTRRVAADARRAETQVLHDDTHSARLQNEWESVVRLTHEHALAGPLSLADAKTGADAWLSATPDPVELPWGPAWDGTPSAVPGVADLRTHAAARERLLRDGLATLEARVGADHRSTRVLAAALADLLRRDARPLEAERLRRSAVGLQKPLCGAPVLSRRASASSKRSSPQAQLYYTCGGAAPAEVFAVHYDPVGPSVWLLSAQLRWHHATIRPTGPPMRLDAAGTSAADAVIAAVGALCDVCGVPHDMPALGWPLLERALWRISDCVAVPFQSPAKLTLSDPNFLTHTRSEQHDEVRRILTRLPALAAQALETEALAWGDDAKAAAVVCARLCTHALRHCKIAGEHPWLRTGAQLCADASILCLSACVAANPVHARGAILGCLLHPPAAHLRRGGTSGWDYPGFCVRMCEAAVITADELVARAEEVESGRQTALVSRRRAEQFLSLFSRFAALAPMLDLDQTADSPHGTLVARPTVPELAIGRRRESIEAKGLGAAVAELCTDQHFVLRRHAEGLISELRHQTSMLLAVPLTTESGESDIVLDRGSGVFGQRRPA